MSKSKKTRSAEQKKRRQQMKQNLAGPKGFGGILIPGRTGNGIIKQLWAEHGVVKVRVNDNTVKSMTWQDAARRAGQLNAAVPLLPHIETKRVYLELIERIVKVVKEARHQLEMHDKKTDGLHNLLAGKNEDGSTPNVGKLEDYLLDDYKKQFPTMDEDEIVVILRDEVKWPTMREKETVLRTINNERLKQQRQQQQPVTLT